MPRPSPQTDRVVTLLNLIASRPTTSFTLPEIAAHLSVHTTSLYPMIAALVDAGFIIRHPLDKTIRLGPALIPLGEAAAQSLPILEAARTIVRDLHRELGAYCYAFSSSDGHEILVEAAPLGPDSPGPRLGQRTRLAAPNGAISVAWTNRAVVRKWLDLPRGEQIPEEMLDALGYIRERGYVVHLREMPSDVLMKLVEEGKTHFLPREEQEFLNRLARSIPPREHPFLNALSRDQEYQISGISAPIFDRHGDVIMSITVVPFSLVSTGRQIESYGRALVERTSAATRLLGGVVPKTQL